MLCTFLVSESYLGAKNNFLRHWENGYGTCCIIGIKNLYLATKTTFNDFYKKVMVLSVILAAIWVF